jgi:hypothetical protein
MSRRRLIDVLVVGVVACALAALLFPAILAAREAGRIVRCENSLKQMSLGIASYGDTFKRFPAGTSGNLSLPPEQRFSWYPPLWHFFEGKPPKLLVDENQPWNAAVNRSPQAKYIVDWDMPTRHVEVGPLPHLHLFSCPNASSEERIFGIQLTQYVGMAGLGRRSPELERDEPGVGFWGYDRQLKIDDLERGASNIVMLIETGYETGPWLAAGRPTVRGYEPDGAPVFGEGRQFGGLHSVCLAAMADGSVRRFDDAIDPAAFSAMTTIRPHVRQRADD